MLVVGNDVLFGVFTNLFILGWLFVSIASFLGEASQLRRYFLLIGGRIIPLILLMSFVVGWALTRGLPGDITSLEGVLVGFSVPEKVLLAWFEILGLALLVARWMVEDSAAGQVPKVILLLGLAGTFVAAAIGLVGYLLLSRCWRWIVPQAGS